MGKMSDFFFLIPISLALGLAGLVLFLWSLKNGQYEDLDGASERILYDDDMPLPGGDQKHADGHASLYKQ